MSNRFRTIKINELPAEKNVSALYLNVIHNPHASISALERSLEDTVNGGLVVPLTPTPITPVRLSSDVEYALKLSEMLGEKLEFSVGQFEKDKQSRDSVITATSLALLHENAIVEKDEAVQGNLKVTIPERGYFVFNEQGIITETNILDKIVGHDALHYMSCHVQQDFGVVIKKDEKLVYTFDSAMFEKTPKDIVTGINYFLGRDLMEFHTRGPNFGTRMPGIFQNLVEALRTNKIDHLVVDLPGANVYSDGKSQVRRFERDFVTPMKVESDLDGFIVYTDVFFQDVNEPITPYNGGEFLDIKDPKKFHQEFKVIEDG
ncbi:hypothetical protein HOE37_03470 [Candidatus Woesearchaeota archaeon]|nr:hypothetical protein [Candidatus Woesearchaeota archaeon]MBT4110890.1 hypothetical protein [Candidatus Woesearchaeota archaeon]MBT4336598.1 hypothetical protein [Candidatus Woesearchaeota archaeon]MBT4469653.1 hypothetical protein [Candidatus Woesearchaeota archaeon]MBT6744015.1 hypothetical protein [Candidatus Woesearchaeota archaeon]